MRAWIPLPCPGCGLRPAARDGACRRCWAAIDALPDATGPIPKGPLRDILRQATRFHLIRFEPAEPFEESGIEVLPTIRRVIPFRDLAAWTEAANAFAKSDDSDEPAEHTEDS